VAWVVLVSISLFQAYAQRYAVSPDGISYLDMSDAVVGGDWSRLINLYWSPLYPTLLAVIATYYILFAVMGSSTPALAIESAVAGTFLVLAVVGFKKNLWLVVAALAGHGVFDFFHQLIIQNPGVPMWWPGFCLSFDILAGGFLAMLLMRRSGFTHGLK